MSSADLSLLYFNSLLIFSCGDLKLLSKTTRSDCSRYRRKRRSTAKSDSDSEASDSDGSSDSATDSSYEHKKVHN